MRRLQKAVEQSIEALGALQRAGVTQVTVSPGTLEALPVPPRTRRAPAALALETGLDRLRARALVCARCAELAGCRTQVVFGVGNPRAALMFIGEAPGRDEDLEGEPFVGRAGELLTKIIQAMGYKRHEVYIANVLKCRPPENRTPLPDEVQNCLPYLVEQITLVQPQVIVALGAVAVRALLDVQLGITKMRGNWYEFHGIPIMPTFHPAYLLRNPGAKREVWQDMQAVMERLGKKDSCEKS